MTESDDRESVNNKADFKVGVDKRLFVKGILNPGVGWGMAAKTRES